MVELGKRLDSLRAREEIISGISKEQPIISNTAQTHSAADRHL